MDDKNSATMPERFLPQHKDPYKYVYIGYRTTSASDATYTEF